MEIFQVTGSLVCTRRHSGMSSFPLRVLKDAKGKTAVALDTVGSREGNWVFTISGSAARYALEDHTILTDLTIGGIIEGFE